MIIKYCERKTIYFLLYTKEMKRTLKRFGKEELRGTINNRQFFYCGYDYLNNLCVNINNIKKMACMNFPLIFYDFQFKLNFSRIDWRETEQGAQTSKGENNRPALLLC